MPDPTRPDTFGADDVEEPPRNFENVLNTASVYLADLYYNMFFIMAQKLRVTEQLGTSISQIYVGIVNEFISELVFTANGKLNLCTNLQHYFERWLKTSGWDHFLTIFVEQFVQKKYFQILTTAQKAEYAISILTSVNIAFSDMVINRPTATGESRLRMVIDTRSMGNIELFADELVELFRLERDKLNQQFLAAASQTTPKRVNNEYKLKQLIALQKVKILELQKQVQSLNGELYRLGQVSSASSSSLASPTPYEQPRPGSGPQPRPGSGPQLRPGSRSEPEPHPEPHPQSQLRYPYSQPRAPRSPRSGSLFESESKSRTETDSKNVSIARDVRDWEAEPEPEPEPEFESEAELEPEPEDDRADLPSAFDNEVDDFSLFDIIRS